MNHAAESFKRSIINKRKEIIKSIGKETITKEDWIEILKKELETIENSSDSDLLMSVANLGSSCLAWSNELIYKED